MPFYLPQRRKNTRQAKNPQIRGARKTLFARELLEELCTEPKVPTFCPRSKGQPDAPNPLPKKRFSIAGQRSRGTCRARVLRYFLATNHCQPPPELRGPGEFQFIRMAPKEHTAHHESHESPATTDRSTTPALPSPCPLCTLHYRSRSSPLAGREFSGLLAKRE
jgi:hypothetical protein